MAQYQNKGYAVTNQPGSYASPDQAPPVTSQDMIANPAGPPGLEYLSQVDQLLIHQQVEILEVLTGWETANKYIVKNSLGQQVYFAGEESDACNRVCCGPSRGFLMHITDNAGNEIIRVQRVFKCCAGGCGCCVENNTCRMEISVESPVGVVVGYTQQLNGCIRTRYVVMDANREPVFKIVGPPCSCHCNCFKDIKFKIYSLDESQELGTISKQWSGFGREFMTDANNFSVTFPLDLDVRMKAILFGTVFLVDFMHFEQKNN